MTKDNTHYNILIIEDNPGDASLIEAYLQEQIDMPQMHLVKNFKGVKQLFVQEVPKFDVILLDLSLPDKSGKNLVEEILLLPNINCPVIVLTGFADVLFSKEMIQLGISDYLVKDDLSGLVLYKAIIYAIERWKFTKQIEESEKKFSSLFELSPQPMWVYDVTTLRFLQVNKAATIAYGYSEAEFLQMILPDLTFGIPTQKAIADIAALQHTGGDHYTGSGQHQKKSGEVIDIEFYSSFLHFNNQLCRSAIIIDVTERKKADHTLKVSEAKYREAQRLGKMGSWDLNLKTNELTWSDEIFSIFNIEHLNNKVDFSDFYSRIHPDDRAEFEVAQAAALAGTKKLDFIHRIVKPSGALSYVHELGVLVLNDEGEATHFIGTVQDVTTRVVNETSLRQSEARLQGILDSQTSYILRTDLQGNYTYCNHNFTDEFGWIYKEQKVLGQNGLTSIMEYHWDRVQAVVGQCMQNPLKIFQVELDKPGKENVVRTTLWDFVCLPNEHNEPEEMQCVGIDTTDWKKAERQFVKTLEERNTILESIGDAFFAIDRNWIVTYWNNEAEKVSGIMRSAIVGVSIYDSFPQLHNTVFLQHLQQAFETNNRSRFDIYFKNFGIWLDVSVFPTENGMAVYLRDITDRKISDAELAANERKLQVLFDTVSEIIFMVVIEDADKEHYRFSAMNNAGLVAMGVEEHQVIGKYVHHVIPSPSLEIVLENYKKAVDQKKAVTWLEETEYPAGLKTAKVTVSPVFNDAGECLSLVGSIRDITEQLAYEGKLKTSAAELRQLALHLQQVREDERLHIAREIHDELGQQLTGIKMDISWLKRKLKADDTAINKKIEESLSLINNTIKTVRKIAAELRPSVLDDLGLEEAINWLSEEFTKRSGIEVKCHSNLNNAHYESNISVAIFRIYQESLTNISRHAQASHVSCRLDHIDNNLTLTVRDNGVGFDKEHQKEKRTLGLLGMKERVMQLNGQYDINSEPGKGTVVSVSIPIV